tara:strand:- start:2172 stop:3167 length:996 start_codon:yes stop_codon:yes gene_type:complete
MPDFAGLQAEVLNLAGADAGGDYGAMVKASLNRVMFRALQKVDKDLERREFSLTTVASTSQYAMPLEMRRVLNIEDSANQKRIFDITARTFDNNYPGDTQTGSPDRAYPLGSFGVSSQPVTATTIEVVSSSASDSSGITVRVTGYVEGVLSTESIVVNGTTPVVSTNTYDAGGLERVVRSAVLGTVPVGNLTIRTVSVGATHAIIPVIYPSSWSPTYLWYEFHPIPATPLTYTVRGVMRKRALINDDDWPDIDEEFHNMLVWGAGSEVLPVLGKMGVANRLRLDFETALDEFAGIQEERPNLMRVFSDVTTGPSISPNRPFIPGIDVGQAS